MKLFERLHQDGFEQVVYCMDRDTGLKAIIAVHSTVLGPACGGCRMYPYANEAEALEDVLRLSRGMTYKSSLCGNDLGGGKAVIIGDPKKDKTPALLKKFGEYVDRLGGTYMTAKDVGIMSDDLKIVKSVTKHVIGIQGVPGSSGDPSPATAWGAYHGMKAAAKFVYGSESLKGKTIAVQGLGAVAYGLVKHLVDEGANVIGADVDAAAVERCKKEFGIRISTPEKILFEECDIVSPNALGAVLNEGSIPKLHARIVAGAANNQLATPKDGTRLMERGIVYAPDYAINAGGIRNIQEELDGFNEVRAMKNVAKIGTTILNILERAAKEKSPPHVIADRMAEERIQGARR